MSNIKKTKNCKKIKKTKKAKLESLPKKRRRLMRMWTEKVHSMQHEVCAVCGKAHGSIDPITCKPSYLNAHHIEPRATCAALRYDPINGILLCPSCHKFGRNSAHKGSIWFITWLHDHRRLQYDYVMNHRDEVVNINDRVYLDNVENYLSRNPTAEEIDIVTTKEKENDSECFKGQAQ